MAWFSGRKGQHTHTTGEEQRLEAGCALMHRLEAGCTLMHCLEAGGTLMRRLTIFDKGEKFSSETVFYFFNVFKPNRYPNANRARAYIPVEKDYRPNVKT